MTSEILRRQKLGPLHSGLVYGLSQWLVLPFMTGAGVQRLEALKFVLCPLVRLAILHLCGGVTSHML